MSGIFSFVLEGKKSLLMFRSLIEKLKKANNEVKIIADNSKVLFVTQIQTKTSSIEITLYKPFFSCYECSLNEPNVTFAISLTQLEFCVKKSITHLIFTVEPHQSKVKIAVGDGKFKEVCEFNFSSQSYYDFQRVIGHVDDIRPFKSFDAEVFYGLKKIFRESSHIFIFAEKQGVMLSSIKERRYNVNQRVVRLNAKQSDNNDDSVHIKLNLYDLLLSINMTDLFSSEIKFYFENEQPALIVRATGRHCEMKFLIEAEGFEYDSDDVVPAIDDASHRNEMVETPLTSPASRNLPPVQTGKVSLPLIEDIDTRRKPQSILPDLAPGSQELFKRRVFSVYAENSQPQSSDTE